LSASSCWSVTLVVWDLGLHSSLSRAEHDSRHG